MLIKKLLQQILLIGIILLSIISCKSKNDSIKEKSKIEYDGYNESHSLTPENFKEKFYFDLEISVKSENRITINGKEVKYESLFEEIDKKWKIIENDDYNGFINLQLGNTKDADYKFYLKTYNLIKNFRRDKKEEFSKEEFKKEYNTLNKIEKKLVDQNILINIVESEPEINWE